MFERRLKWFAIGMTMLAVIIVARLAQIQIAQAGQYQVLADRLLTREERTIRAPRGEILDRAGRVLVRDEPAWDVSVKYDVIAGNDDYLFAVARNLKKDGRQPRARPLREIVEELRADVLRSWHRLSALTGVPIPEFIERGQAVLDRVERIRQSVFERTGILRPVREEQSFHAMVAGVDDELALKIRLEMERDYPWLAVVPGSRRRAHDADALVHVLGRIGSASRERIAADPLADDELRALRPGDQCGVSGVELLAESVLRGRRGRIIEDFGREEIERTDPVQGGAAQLTIDAQLQRDVLEALEAGVKAAQREAEAGEGQSTGGSAVVIDVETREILAMASYPGYSYDNFSRGYDELRRDMRYQPLRFRAVSEHYPPGSVGKVATAIAGLSEGVVTAETRFRCTGHFLESQPNAFRCWIYNRYAGQTHDATNPRGQNAIDAIRYSCNIYFFNVGDKLGGPRLCDWFRKVGLGATQGTGLTEEADGIIPDEEFLRRRRNRTFEPADAWNFSIGQGEVTATPLQAANVAATVASGWRLPVKLLKNTEIEIERPFEPLEFDENVLQIVRTGMWEVVNKEGGTAYQAANLKREDWQLCGKTGSAQAMPRVVSRDYTFAWPDGKREVIRAGTEEDAERELRKRNPEAFDRDPLWTGGVAVAARPVKLIGSQVAERYPPWKPDDKLPSHAWFIGWLQSGSTPRGARPAGRCYAISVIIEYGGSGGHQAAPVAKRIAEALLRGDAVAQ